MPLYVFECPACGRTEEVLRTMDCRDRSPPVCTVNRHIHPLRSQVVMVRIVTPVAGFVRNPAAGPKRYG